MANTSAPESFTLLGIALLVIGIRMWWRWTQVGFSGFQLDDHIMPLSGLLFAAVTALAYLVPARYDGLTNSYMTASERASMDPDSEEAYNRMMGSKIQVAGWSLYALELWTLKLCIVVFYSRLTTRLTNLVWRVRIGYILVGATYVAAALSLVLGCQPFDHYWQVQPNPGRLCQPTNSPLNVLIVYVPNVVTDLYLLSIPLPLLWKVNISIRRKLTLMLLFSGAIFVITAATIRAVVIITAGPNGAIQGSRWACREIFVAAFVTNLPIIQPFLRQMANKVGLSVLFSRSAKSSNNGVGGGKSYPLGSKDAGNTGGSRSAYMLSRVTGNRTTVTRADAAGTHTAAWGSDEEVLFDGKDGGKGGRGQNAENGGKTIVVAQEVSIVSSEANKNNNSSNPAAGDWGFNSMHKATSNHSSSS